MNRSVLSAFCAVVILVLAGVVGCGDGPEPTPAPTPDARDADFSVCYETCSAKGGSDSNCRTFCAGGTIERPAKEEAKAPGGDSESCYEPCIAKGASESECRGYCEEGKPGNEEGKPGNDTSTVLTFEHDGAARQYVFHAPADLPANAPLVFFLHGLGGDAGETRSWVGLGRVADANGFAVAYPQGSGNYDGTPYWNAHTFPGVTDDIGFLSALARSLQSEHSLDPERTFAAGFSNGGLMSYLLAMEAPGVFRGVASVVGAPSGSAWEDRDSATAAFPLLQISGLDDRVVPIDGIVNPSGGSGAPPLDDVIEYWSGRNGCSTTETDTLNPNTTRRRHVDCAEGNEVWYYRVDNFGHEWPTVDGSAGFAGGEVIWEFFGRF